MRVDPTDTAPVKLSVADERDDFIVTHDRRLIHALVVPQQLFAPSLIANEEFAVDEVVAAHFVATQEVVQFRRVWQPIRRNGIIRSTRRPW